MAVETNVIRDEELLDKLVTAREQILREIRKTIIGQDEVVEQVLISLFVGGHSIITGVPGLAKTLLIRTRRQRARPYLQTHSIHARPDAGRHHRHGNHRRRSRDRPASICSSSAARFSPTSFSRTKSTGRRPRRRPRCSKPCRNSRSPSAGRRYHAAASRSSCSRRKTRSSMEGTYPLPEAQLDRFMFNVASAICRKPMRSLSSNGRPRRRM